MEENKNENMPEQSTESSQPENQPQAQEETGQVEIEQRTPEASQMDDSNLKTQPTGQQMSSTAGADKKIVAGILAILLGAIGIHKFYLGYITEGVIMILLNFLCGISAIIGLIEGIIYLTKSDQEFVDTYINNRRGWF